MEKRLLLHWIALHSADISPGHVQLSAVIESHLAHTWLAFRNRTAVSAGKAAHPIAINWLVEMKIAFAHMLIEDFAQGRQGGVPLLLF